MDSQVLLIILLGGIIGLYSATGTKSQLVRILDGFLIGPLMIYLGFIGYKMSNNSNISVLFLLLTLLGASTISYNLRNYIITKQ